jgi:hypothetical protein
MNTLCMFSERYYMARFSSFILAAVLFTSGVSTVNATDPVTAGELVHMGVSAAGLSVGCAIDLVSLGVSTVWNIAGIQHVPLCLLISYVGYKEYQEWKARQLQAALQEQNDEAASHEDVVQ